MIISELLVKSEEVSPSFPSMNRLTIVKKRNSSDALTFGGETMKHRSSFFKNQGLNVFDDDDYSD